MVRSPTGPHPKTTTVSSFFTFAISVPQREVGKISVKNRTCSSVNSSGTFTGPTFACGTLIYSAWPPA